jgi:hypothetical protein
MSEVELTFNRQWAHLMNTCEIGRKAAAQGLRRAGAQALAEVLKNFQARGRPKWARLSDSYRKRKREGKAAPGRQQASSARGLADNVLTGALLMAAVARPRSKLGPDFLDLWPNPTVYLGRQPVGVYAGYVNAGTGKMPAREFYVVPHSAMSELARQYVIGFMNVLHGVPDPVGRHLG